MHKDIDHAIEPLTKTAMGLGVEADCHVHGGGKSGQSGAIRMGVARALLRSNPRSDLSSKQTDFSARSKVQGEKGAWSAKSAQEISVTKR